MTDNLNIHGILDDSHPHRRKKISKGRKPYVIETRYVQDEEVRRDSGLRWLFHSLAHWHVHSRYKTESARDTAFAALVKKEKAWWGRRFSRQEFRKV